MTGQDSFHVRLTGGQEFGPAGIDLIEQWAREGRVPIDALLVPADGSSVRSVLAEERLRLALQAVGMPGGAAVPGMVPGAISPPTMAGTMPPATDGGISKMIPYRNPPALIGYYVSIGSLIPLVGVIAGPVAIGLGIAGIRKRNRQPEAHGLAHAWIAIILGLIGTLMGGGCLALTISGMLQRL